jgi:DNA-binding FadR family transcriptional regulator
MDKKMRGPSLSLSIQDYIKDYIVKNQLSAGNPLPSEGQIAEELGVSRSPVREAVKSLQSLGIIEARHGEGLFVREWNFDALLKTFNYGMRIHPKTLADLYQIRVWLEMAIIGDVAKKISNSQIMELDILMLRWKQAVSLNDPYVSYDEAFHRTILSVVQNDALTKLFKVFWVAFENYGEVDLLMAPDPLQVYQEHYDVLAAIKKRDPDLARKTLIQQFKGFKERIDEIVKQSSEMLLEAVKINPK